MCRFFPAVHDNDIDVVHDRLRKAEEHKRLLVREAENAKGRSAAAEVRRSKDGRNLQARQDSILIVIASAAAIALSLALGWPLSISY